MAYKLEFSKRFDKQFSKLDKSTQRYLFNWLIKNVDNVENPRYSGKSLTGNKTGLWRYRIGNYRVIADINDGRCVILALEVGTETIFTNRGYTMKYLRRELNQVEKEYLKQFGQDSLNRVVLHDPNTKDKQEVQDTIDILKDAMAKNKPLEQVPEDMWKLIEF